ncbi:hypothetical protein Tco_0028895 [Tanacetum coccineum]
MDHSWSNMGFRLVMSSYMTNTEEASLSMYIMLNCTMMRSRLMTTKEIHLMCEQGKMKAIPFMAPFLADYAEKLFIYSVVENTCNEAKLYDLDETGEGIVKENFLYVKKDLSKKSPLGENEAQEV